jgi:hypothetical protein
MQRALLRIRLPGPRPLWLRRVLLAGGIVGGLSLLTLIVLWVSYGRMIDARLAGV